MIRIGALMNSDPLRQEVFRFLKSTEPQILCIRGLWGTGKTHFWNQLFKEAVKEKSIGLQRYAYCSLFGIGSLQELKQSIVENTVKGKELADLPSPTSFYENAKESLSRWGEKGLRHSQGVMRTGLEVLGVKSLADFVTPALFLSVQKQIVCIDDIERKGRDLRVGDILGLLSTLKERRQCKSVLILNDKQLEDQKDFDRYLEKVVDVSLVFAPSAERCASLMLTDQSQADVLLRKYCALLGITNMRVISRIRKLSDRLLPSFEGRDPRILEEALKNLCLLSWITFLPDEAPNVEFLRGRTQRRLAAMMRASRSPTLDHEAEPTPPNAQREHFWHALLDEIGSNTLTALDESLLHGIERGFFGDELTSLAAEFETQRRASDAESSFRASWKLFHDSFDENEGELVAALISSTKGAVNFVSPSNLSSTVELLRKLGRSTEADELISYYMENRKADAAFFRLRAGHPIDEVRDEKLLKAFEEKANSFKDVRSLKDVMHSLLGENSSILDRERLREFSVEELREEVKQLRGKELRRMIEYLEQSNEKAANGKSVAENLQTAFDLIAKESALQNLRIASRRGGF